MIDWTEERREKDLAVAKGLISDAIGADPGALLHKDISHLALEDPSFPIDRILLQRPGARMFRGQNADHGRPKDRRRMNSVWGGRLGFEVSEGKSIAEMIDSLLHEEIRKPVALALVAGFGPFLCHGGNNRIGATALRGRTVIPATCSVAMWVSGEPPPSDDAVIEAWQWLCQSGDRDPGSPGRLTMTA